MSHTEAELKVFEAVVFKDNKPIKYMMAGMSHEDIKQQVIHDKKASLVHIRQMTDDLTNDQPGNTKALPSATVYKLSDYRKNAKAGKICL